MSDCKEKPASVLLPFVSILIRVTYEYEYYIQNIQQADVPNYFMNTRAWQRSFVHCTNKYIIKYPQQEYSCIIRCKSKRIKNMRYFITFIHIDILIRLQ